MDCKSNPERHFSEEMARLHCLQALFPDWTGEDRFLLKQLKESIEASLRQDATADTFDNFSSLVISLSFPHNSGPENMLAKHLP